MEQYTLEALCRDIRLAPEAAAQVLALEKELDWDSLEEACGWMARPGMWQEGLDALRSALAPDALGLKMLTCCLRQALNAWPVYQVLGISREIFVETMACFSRFVDEHMESFGCYGFDRAFWTVRQLSVRLLRIGELEYELVEADNEHQIHLHIPSGARLQDEILDNSCRKARELLGRCFPDYAQASIHCDSWLLSPTLRQLLPEESNIRRFQNRFVITPHEPGDSYMQWVFKRTDLALEELPEDTGLQRRLKAYLLSGGIWTEATGIWR